MKIFSAKIFANLFCHSHSLQRNRLRNSPEFVTQKTFVIDFELVPNPVLISDDFRLLHEGEIYQANILFRVYEMQNEVLLVSINFTSRVKNIRTTATAV